MAIDRETLRKYAYDPVAVTSLVLKEIENANNGEVSIVDPTNPFTMLLEAACTGASNAIIECKSVMRKKYPNLATEPDELYHHLMDDEMASMMSEPAEALIAFYVNSLDLRLNGYKPTGANYSETIIPIGTTVTIADTTLTLLNDILVRLYDNNTVFVEQQPSTNDIAYSDTGILQSSILNSNNATSYIVFEAKMKQVVKQTYNYALSLASNFTKILPITGKYYYSEVMYSNSYTSNKYVKLPKAFNDEYINPLQPTCHVGLFDSNIQFSIPEVYALSGLISGNLRIDLYTTNGKMYLPINQYEPKNFSMTLGDTTTSASAATAPNILMWINSRSIIEGGKNGLTLNELRNSIIYNSTGDIDLPITEKQLITSGGIKGYGIYKAVDVVTHRLFIAAKGLPDFTSERMYSRKDILFNTVQFQLDELTDHPSILQTANRTIIKSGAVFKGNNGIMNIIPESELKGLQSLNKTELTDKLSKVKYFYTPYYYIIEHDDTSTEVKVFDFDKPKVVSNMIVGKNSTFTYRVNTGKYELWKTEFGYRLGFAILTNDDFDQLNKEQIGFQVAISLSNGTDFAYYDAIYDAGNNDGEGYWYVDIRTDLETNDNDDLIILNGESKLYSKTMPLNTYCYIYAYTVNSNLDDPTSYLVNDIWKFNETGTYTVFTKEKFDLNFGTKLDYIWNKIFNTYTDRKYKKYSEDIVQTYNQDEYRKTENGFVFTIETKDGKKQLVANKIGSKGDPVYNNGEKVILHKGGGEDADVILGSNGLAVIDQFAGVSRWVDICMFEYEFLVATAQDYTNYNKLMTEAVTNMITVDMKDMNSKLLENTSILYRSPKKYSDVIVGINGNKYNTSCVVKPAVTLYSTVKQNYTVSDFTVFTVTIGDIINKHFEKDTLILEDLRKELKEALGDNIVSVKISGIEDSNSEILTMADYTSRFILAKKMDVDKNNDLIVKYDIDITAVYI